jgi:hypothetical protein
MSHTKTESVAGFTFICSNYDPHTYAHRFILITFYDKIENA